MSEAETLGPTWSRDGFDLYHGDALRVLRALPTASVDALVTDPPYSSGGFTRGDRIMPAVEKYVQGGQAHAWAAFSGDNRDARSWAWWCYLWLSECARIVKPGGYVLTFTDWRQLPLTTDWLQGAGFVWRGLVAWDKGLGSRAPHTGYFRHQCEYVVWGTLGALEPAMHGGPFPGCIRAPNIFSDKFHMTGKPVDLLVELVKCVPPGAVVLDPFMGSATTGVAAWKTGRRFVGIEQDPTYYRVSEDRIAATMKNAPNVSRSLQSQPALFEGADAPPEPTPADDAADAAADAERIARRDADREARRAARAADEELTRSRSEPTS